MRRFRCVNPDCPKVREQLRPAYEFEDADKDARCPECDAEPLPVVMIHLLVKDLQGPIRTRLGRRRIACAPEFAAVKGRLACETVAVTCPACVASSYFRAMQAEAVLADEHEIPAGVPLGGCC